MLKIDSPLSNPGESMAVEGNPGRLDEVWAALKGSNILASLRDCLKTPLSHREKVGGEGAFSTV